MAKDKDVGSKKGKEEHSYWRVTITYSDNEISGRVSRIAIKPRAMRTGRRKHRS